MLRQELSKMTADEAAQRLLGAEIVRTFEDRLVRLTIVETESYDQLDQASHSFKRTPRSEPMYGPAGLAYVYFIYGNYYCFNVVCDGEGFGAGVLIRAAEPLDNRDWLRAKREVDNVTDTTNGPGKLCLALDIDRKLLGHDLTKPPLQVVLRPALPSGSIVQTTRIGISKAVHELRRFYIKDNKFVSKP